MRPQPLSFLYLIAAASIVSSNALAEEQRTRRDDSPNLKLSVERQSTAIDTQAGITLALGDSADGRKLKIRRSSMDLVHEVHSYANERLVLVGTRSGKQRVVVVDIAAGSVVESFGAAAVAVSGDGRFVGFHSIRSEAAGATEILVYDVASSHSTPDNTGSSVAGAEIGQLVFSRRRVNTGEGVQYADGDPSGNWFRRSGLRWLDNHHLAFVDFSKPYTSLVILDFRRGLNSARTAKIPIGKNSVFGVSSIDVLERMEGDRWNLRISFRGENAPPPGWLDVVVGPQKYKLDN